MLPLLLPLGVARAAIEAVVAAVDRRVSAQRGERRVDRAAHRVRVGLGRVPLALEPADVLALDVRVRQAALVLLAPLVARARRLYPEDAVDVGAL